MESVGCCYIIAPTSTISPWVQLSVVETVPSMASKSCQILMTGFSNTYYDLTNQSGQSTTNVGKASFNLRLADIAMHGDVRILFYTPQYSQRFLRGLGILVYIVENICLIKMHRIFGHISLLFCKLLNC